MHGHTAPITCIRAAILSVYCQYQFQTRTTTPRKPSQQWYCTIRTNYLSDSMAEQAKLDKLSPVDIRVVDICIAL